MKLQRANSQPGGQARAPKGAGKNLSLGKATRVAVCSGGKGGKGGDGGKGRVEGKGRSESASDGEAPVWRHLKQLVHCDAKSPLNEPFPKSDVAVGDIVIVSPLMEITDAKRALIQAKLDAGRPDDDEEAIEFFIDTTDVIFMMWPFGLDDGHHVTVRMSNQIELEVNVEVCCHARHPGHTHTHATVPKKPQTTPKKPQGCKNADDIAEAVEIAIQDSTMPWQYTRVTEIRDVFGITTPVGTFCLNDTTWSTLSADTSSWVMEKVLQIGEAVATVRVRVCQEHPPNTTPPPQMSQTARACLAPADIAASSGRFSVHALPDQPGPDGRLRCTAMHVQGRRAV